MPLPLLGTAFTFSSSDFHYRSESNRRGSRHAHNRNRRIVTGPLSWSQLPHCPGRPVLLIYKCPSLPRPRSAPRAVTPNLCLLLKRHLALMLPSFSSRLFPGNSVLLNQKRHQDVSEKKAFPDPGCPPKATRWYWRNGNQLFLIGPRANP